jgi:multidrug/hemolysin transport system ATP-binding protein
MEKVIEIKNLCKSFGEVKAVNDLTFSVRKGELYAFLGVNGAGKSTTISVICGALEADSGEVIVNGCDVKRDYKKVKNEIGIVFQNSVLDGALSVYENLKIRASLYGILDQKFEEKYLEVSKYFNLDEIKNRTVSKLSGG